MQVFVCIFMDTFLYLLTIYTRGAQMCVGLQHGTYCMSLFLCNYEVAPRFLCNLCNPDIRRYFCSYFLLETAFTLTSTRNIHSQYLILTFVYKRSDKCVNTVYRMRDTACGLVVVVLQVSWLMDRY